MRVEKEEALTHGYVPSEVRYREEEYGRIIRELSLINHGFAPPHMVLLGLPGCGKTLTVRKALLDQEVPHVLVNSEPSAYDTLVAIGERVIGRRFRGLGFGLVWSEIEKNLPEKCCVVLDEADRFMVRDQRSDLLLYHLSRRSGTGLFLISNRMDLLNFVRDTRVKSSFLPIRLYFRPYGVKELEGILMQRARDALGSSYREEAVAEAVKLIAAKAVKRGGDARYAIDLLRESIKTAAYAGSDVVTETHVREASRVVSDAQIADILSSLTLPHKLLLLTALGTRSVGAAYRRYNEVAGMYGMPPLTERWLRKIFADLEMIGFLRAVRTGQKTWVIDIPAWVDTPAMRQKLEMDLKANSFSSSPIRNSRPAQNRTLMDFR